MNTFELYCMVFYMLDATWDESHNKELANYFSSANPFLFADIGSANPAVYKHFCDIIPEDKMFA